MKTSFATRVSQMGLGSFVDINIFLHILISFRISKLKIYTNIKTPKMKLGVSFNNFLFKLELRRTAPSKNRIC